MRRLSPAREKESKNFIQACGSGNISQITRLFSQVSPDLYREGLTLLLDFLAKAPPQEKDFSTIKSYGDVLRLFSAHLHLYDDDFIVKQIKLISDKYKPAAKILFRAFSKKVRLYILNQKPKKGCARVAVSTCSELKTRKLEIFLGNRDSLKCFVDYPVLKLFYSSRKTKKVKWEVELGRQHIDLKAALPLGVHEGNVATSALTFMLKISRPSTPKKYLEITLPVFIPTHGALEERALHFDEVKARSCRPYEKLRLLFDQGLGSLGVLKKEHGHAPNYENPEASRAADSIKHSEQSLALYLYGEKNVCSIVKQLALALHQIGAQVQAGDVVKVIAIALHIHSSKTPCAVCETVLTGLMDREDGAFLSRFTQALPQTKNVFQFVAPKSGIRLHVLYSADAIDADHKEEKQKKIGAITPCEMREKSARVFCSLFKGGLRRDYTSFSSEDVSQYGVSSSGGASSEKSRKTNRRINEGYQKERDSGLEALRLFGLRLDLENKMLEEEERKIIEQEKEYRLFLEWISEAFGIFKQSVLGNGNCQFFALAEQLSQAYPDGLTGKIKETIGEYDSIDELSQILRKLVVKHLEKKEQRSIFEKTVSDGDFPPGWVGKIDFDSFLEHLRQNDSWGGALTFPALVEILGLPILVLHPSMKKSMADIEHRIYVPSDNPVLGDFDRQCWLTIIYNGDNHYDTITDRPTENLADFILKSLSALKTVTPKV